MMMYELKMSPEGENNNIYIVLTRSTTALSRIVTFLTGAEFTHSAISLDKELSHMFSFGRRYTNNPFIGCFHREDISEGAYAKAPDVPGLIIELPVSASQYKKVYDTIREFLMNGHRYDFNYLGLFKQVVGRPHYSEGRFYCSEFVYHTLSEAGIIDLSIPRGRVRPQDFMWLGKEIYKGDLRAFLKKSKAKTKSNVVPYIRRFEVNV